MSGSHRSLVMDICLRSKTGLTSCSELLVIGPMSVAPLLASRDLPPPPFSLPFPPFVIPYATFVPRLQNHLSPTQVESVAVLNHPNLVRLLGFCVDFDAQKERQEQVLVYEFAAGGDLLSLLNQKGELAQGGRRWGGRIHHPHSQRSIPYRYHHSIW